MAIFHERQLCWMEMTWQFLNVFLSHVSAFIIALLAFDRFARIRYLHEYKIKMSKSRINRLTFSVISLALFNASLITLGTKLQMYKIFSLAIFSIDGLVVLVMVVLNIMAVRAMNRHCLEMKSTFDGDKHTTRLEDVRVNVVALTKGILCTVCVLYGIFVVLTLIHLFAYDRTQTLYWQNILEFWLFLGYMLGVSNSTVNAIIFIKFNRECHKLVAKLFGRRKKRTFIVLNIESSSMTQTTESFRTTES